MEESLIEKVRNLIQFWSLVIPKIENEEKFTQDEIDKMKISIMESRYLLNNIEYECKGQN